MPQDQLSANIDRDIIINAISQNPRVSLKQIAESTYSQVKDRYASPESWYSHVRRSRKAKDVKAQTVSDSLTASGSVTPKCNTENIHQPIESVLQFGVKFPEALMPQCAKNNKNFPAALIPAAKAVELAIYSPYVLGERPLSLQVIAEVDTGKTEVLDQYDTTRAVKLATDISQKGIINTYFKQLERGQLKTIIVPDLIKLTGPGRRETIKFLNALTEEGVGEIHTAYMDYQPKKGGKLRANIISSITTGVYTDQKDEWTKMGFIRRSLKVSFGYTQEDITIGEDAILDGKQVFKPTKLNVPNEPVKINISEKHKAAVKAIGRAVKIGQGEPYTGFSSLKHILKLVSANAVANGRSSVNDEDITVARGMVPFCFNPTQGDACQWAIITVLTRQPTTYTNLIESVRSFNYSEETVRTRLERLVKMRIASKSGDGEYFLPLEGEPDV